MPDHQNQATLKYNQILVRPSCRLFLNWQSSYLVRRANLLAVIWRRNVIVIQKKLNRCHKLAKNMLSIIFLDFGTFVIESPLHCQLGPTPSSIPWLKNWGNWRVLQEKLSAVTSTSGLLQDPSQSSYHSSN